MTGDPLWILLPALFPLAAVAPETMRPTALALNILVALFTTWRSWKAGYFSWQALWPFLASSVPLYYERCTPEEMQAMTAPLIARITELEVELARRPAVPPPGA